MAGKDYVQIYIDAVEAGEIIVGKKIQKAIDRHKKDLWRMENEANFEYVYKPEQAEMIITFIGMLPDPKTREPNEIAKFQNFILCLLWGWRHKKTNCRRFTKAYISLARKNGKSLLVSGIALYCLLFERNTKSARQIYATANKQDQARIVFNMVKSQLKALRGSSKEVKKRTKILQKEIVTNDESYMKPLSSDADTLDGLDTLLGIFDEYSYSKTTEMMEVIETSMSQQDEPLIIIISTASNKLNYPMYDIEYKYVEKILSGEVEDEEYLALCWEQDNVKEVNDESLWIKSNPLLESNNEKVVTRTIKRIRKLYLEGLAKGFVSNVLTKHFNLWVLASIESFMSADEWIKAKKVIENSSLKGRKIFVGLDLSRVGDITSISWAIPIEELEKIYIDSHSFIGNKAGIEAKEKEDKTPYRQYAKAGYCEITTLESGLVDHKDMLIWLEDFIESNELIVVAICYDPYNFNQLIPLLEERWGDKLIEVRQGYITLSPAIKRFKEDILNKVAIHGENPLLTRAINNAIVVEQNDAWMIDKKMNRNKIDPLAALLNAYTRIMYFDFNEVTVDELVANGEYGFGH